MPKTVRNGQDLQVTKLLYQQARLLSEDWERLPYGKLWGGCTAARVLADARPLRLWAFTS